MSSLVQRNDHFSIPIIHTARALHFERHQQGLVDLALFVRSEGPGVNRSNKNGFHSAPDIHRRDDPHIHWLVAEVLKMLEAAQATIPGGTRRGKPHVREMWVNVHGAGGYNAPHSHAPNHWSGVFYVQAEETRAGLKPQDADGTICFYNPNQQTIPYGARAQIRHVPIDGTMMLFPGFLLHTVFPHRREHLRISIAFNANLRSNRD